MADSHSSQLSTVTTSSGNGNLQGICRICKGKGRLDYPLISPCYCSGCMRYAHPTCLEKWIQDVGSTRCDLCKFQFIMQKKNRPLRKWKIGALCFGCTFGFITMYFVFLIVATVSSLWIIIKGMADSVSGTEVFFCVIILTAGVFYLFMTCVIGYIVFERWRILNTSFYVQDAPEKGGMTQQQEETVLDLVTAQLSPNESQNEKAKLLLPDADVLQRCQSNGNKTMNDQMCRSNSVAFNNTMNTSVETPTAEACYTELIPTSMRDNRLVCM